MNEIVDAKGVFPRDELEDFFADLPEMDRLEFKKEELANQLAALMAFSERNRTSMAEGMGCVKGRITKILSGSENLTIKTIYQFCDYLGYDFDLVFRRPNELKCPQPWQPVLGVLIEAAGLQKSSVVMLRTEFAATPAFVSRSTTRSSVSCYQISGGGASRGMIFPSSFD